jgi:hypothetical protein
MANGYRIKRKVYAELKVCGCGHGCMWNECPMPKTKNLGNVKWWPLFHPVFYVKSKIRIYRNRRNEPCQTRS